jgi:hypothetical protein
MNEQAIAKELIDDIRELCTQKGWRINLPLEPRKNIALYSEYVFPAYLALVHSELTEALEAYRDKVWSETCIATGTGLTHIKHCSGKPHDQPKPVGVGPELADAIIRILDMCDIWGIDINHEISRVLNYGWTRSYRHGGRTL